MTQFVYVFLPGRQLLNYYLCSRLLKLSQLKDPFYKPNWQLSALLISSFLLHTCANVKIKLYKRKVTRSVFVISNAEHLKNSAISFVDNRAISNFVTSICGVVASAGFILSTSTVNIISPEKFNFYPYYLIFYFLHNIGPFIITGAILLPYYVRNPSLKKMIYRELKMNFRCFFR